MLIDLHVHTTRGSGDSSLSPGDLVAAAARAGLDGVCVTEHSKLWEAHEVAKLEGESGIRVYQGLEIETEAGHVLVIGGKGYAPGMHRLESLVDHAAIDHAALVFAHPYRHHTDPAPGQECLLTEAAGLDASTPAAASRLPALSAVHAIEAVNGATSDADNAFASEVARRLDMPVTGGSDAHSVHGLGAGVTEVSGEPRDSGELADAIRQGEVRAAHGPPVRCLRFVAPASRRPTG